jgi:hypothetical protein
MDSIVEGIWEVTEVEDYEGTRVLERFVDEEVALMYVQMFIDWTYVHDKPDFQRKEHEEGVEFVHKGTHFWVKYKKIRATIPDDLSAWYTVHKDK